MATGMVVQDRLVSFVQYGDGPKEVVLLHGWGQNIKMMDFVGKKLENAHVTVLDLPGFGNSREPKESMNVQEYAEWLSVVLNLLDIENPVIVGHSFGGRVAVKYAANYDVDKLVLLATPIIRHRKKPTLSEKIYKVVKSTPIGGYVRNMVASDDYKNASPIMRETLVKAVTEDLLEDAKKIEAPTILLAGIEDTAVSLQDTELVASQMKDAAVIKQFGTHYAYLENLDQTCAIINEFIKPVKTLKKM